MTDPAARVILLSLDVDGVLTNGSINLDDLGRETKRFHVRDGFGISTWRRLGYHTAIITGRQGMAVHHRATEMGIDTVIQGRPDKRQAFDVMLKQLDVHPEQVAHIGDDLPDLPVMRRCGYPIAVADAVSEVRDAASFVTVRPGGHGAVREAVEHLLQSRDQWSGVVDSYD